MDTTLTIAGTVALFSGWASFFYQWKKDQTKTLRGEWQTALRALDKQLVQTRILHQIEQRLSERLARETESRPATVKTEMRDFVAKELDGIRPLSELTSPSAIARLRHEISTKLDSTSRGMSSSSTA